LAAITSKIETIQLKKHKLQVYMALCDGITPPELPVNLKGKTVTSPVTSIEEATKPIEFIRELTTETNEWESSLQEQNSFVTNTFPTKKQFSQAIICKARVLYEFEASPNSMEMSVSVDEEIDILEKQEDG
jgi:hypothetical protein